MRRPVSGVTFAGVMLTMLMISTLFLAFNVRPANSSPATIIVPDDYPTIQAAIDNASAGDTIFVRAGTYNCHIEIDKPLTLKGENSQNTTLNLQGLGGIIFGIHVIASNVTISGFHLIGPQSTGGNSVMLIVVDGADNCVIKDNVLEEYSGEALTLFGSHGDEVVGNVISSQSSAQSLGGSCMYLVSSRNCLLRNNSLSGSELAGIMLLSSNNNTVSSNFITNQIDSLWFHTGAITLGTSSAGNTVTGNTLVNNDYGVSCWRYTRNNIIYHNSFVNNTHQTYDQLSEQLPVNFWDNGYPSGGNYWSDYHGNDSFSGPYQNVTGGDGIGDAPYVMDAVSSDRYPLMGPWKNPVGDVNMDGKVDGADIAIVAMAFGSFPGDPRWNALADLNEDQRIDGKDIVIVAINFGKS